MRTVRLTAAQAMMRWLSVQMTKDGLRFIEGVWAIFGHGNVAGVGEALHRIGDALPTWRGQNEQTMAHAAIAYAKTKRRRRAQAVTMANSELAIAVMRRVPFTIVLTDNRGYGCINRLQIECGGAECNNMYKDSNVAVQPEIDFVAHAAALGAHAEKAADIADLEAMIVAARGRDVPTVSVIDTDAVPGIGAGGHWWDVAVPAVGGPERLEKARERYDANAARQRVCN